MSEADEETKRLYISIYLRVIRETALEALEWIQQGDGMRLDMAIDAIGDMQQKARKTADKLNKLGKCHKSETVSI